MIYHDVLMIHNDEPMSLLLRQIIDTVLRFMEAVASRSRKRSARIDGHVSNSVLRQMMDITEIKRMQPVMIVSDLVFLCGIVLVSWY